MAEQPVTKRMVHIGRLFLPTPGNVIFTLVVVVGVLWAQNAGALSLFVTPPPIQIPYQGRLADRAGNPLAGDFKMTFRLYNADGAPAQLWSETYQDSNQVKVTNGLFNVLLGSLTPIDQSVISNNPELYLGVTINNDAEMQPRVQLGSVPFATQAWTVPDGLITTAKLAPNAVTSDRITDQSVGNSDLALNAVTSDRIADGTVNTADLAGNAVTSDRIADGSVNTADLANQSVTMAKLGPDVQLLPKGAVIMWSGATNTVPGGWQICDGSNGTPDLRNRFIVGAGSSYNTGQTGGFDQITLTVDQMPAHTHSYTDKYTNGDRESGSHAWDATNDKNPKYSSDTKITASAGGNQPFDNRPPFYALAFICKL